MPANDSAFRGAIIGSFRKHYETVVDAIGSFEAAGIRVVSPKKSRIIDPNTSFVRFETDPKQSEDAVIQLHALYHILTADFVFVIAPDGYVGRTTCYEIGRVHERQIPLYFSHTPSDIPIAVAQSAVIGVRKFSRFVRQNHRLPKISSTEVSSEIRRLEARLRPR